MNKKLFSYEFSNINHQDLSDSDQAFEVKNYENNIVHECHYIPRLILLLQQSVQKIKIQFFS